MIDTNKTGQETCSCLSDLTVKLAADCYAALAPCKKCGGSPTTLISGGLLTPEYFWVCKQCGDKPSPAKTYAGAWNKWQKRNKAANVELRGAHEER